jgi:hypothetical protein
MCRNCGSQARCKHQTDRGFQLLEAVLCSCLARLQRREDNSQTATQRIQHTLTPQLVMYRKATLDRLVKTADHQK